MQYTSEPIRTRRVSTAAAVIIVSPSKQSMSPPWGGDSWKWSETENQSKPASSANVHTRRISSSGPPMCPMWIPNVIAIADSSGRPPDEERARRHRHQPVAPGVHARLEHGRPPRAVQQGRVGPDAAVGHDREVVDLDLERRAALAALEVEARPQRRPHGGVDEREQHAAVDDAVGVHVLLADLDLERRAALADRAAAQAEGVDEPAEAGHRSLNDESRRTSTR